MSLRGWTIETPVAPWSVVQDGDVVLASGFCGLSTLIGRLAVDEVVELGPATGAVATAARAYLGGDRRALEDVSVCQRGGPFHQQLWQAMSRIPWGSTWSYQQLAANAGRPAAARAAGTACARNLLAPFVACHRVVRADGDIGGYEYGRHVKRWLLTHESGR